MATRSHFYVTLFSKASRHIYEQNTHADFMVKLAQPMDLCSNSNWEAGLCEISFSSPPMEKEKFAPICCNMISPQFVCDSIVPTVRSYVFPSSSSFKHEFKNVYYVPVEQRRYQDILIEFLTTEGLHILFEDSTTPTKVVLHFRKNYKLYKTGRRHLE